MSQEKHPIDEAKLLLSAEDVAEYLGKHSDFFNDHTELLSTLSLSRSHGNVTSLLEKQVSVLREKNQQISEQMEELIKNAQHNETLDKKLHELIIALINVADIKDVFGILYTHLSKNMQADNVAIRLFADLITADAMIEQGFFANHADEQSLFKDMLAKRQAQCGPIQAKQCEFLFANHAEKITSAVILPLTGAGWSGVLAVGSFNPARFQAHMSVDLLLNFTEILSCILKKWVVETATDPQ